MNMKDKIVTNARGGFLIFFFPVESLSSLEVRTIISLFLKRPGRSPGPEFDSVENGGRHKRVISISMRFDVPLKISRSPAGVNWCQRTVSSGAAQRDTSRETALLYFCVSLPSLCLSREKKPI